MKTAFFFPGQGSQKVGMVHDLYEKYDSVKKIIREADDTLGFSISKMMFEGPDTELMKTEFTQPAILTASVCCWQVLKEEGVTPDVAAGHSLGEYSALVAAGSISFSDAIIRSIFAASLCRKRYLLVKEAWRLLSAWIRIVSLKSVRVFPRKASRCRRLILIVRDRRLSPGCRGGGKGLCCFEGSRCKEGNHVECKRAFPFFTYGTGGAEAEEGA